MVGKMGLALGVALGILATTPAFADCASAMKSNDAMMMKSTDMTKKDSAMKEQNTAKAMMEKKDEAGCMMHANKAMEMLNKADAFVLAAKAANIRCPRQPSLEIAGPSRRWFCP